jgi:N-acetylneuraminic acid mutarotase
LALAAPGLADGGGWRTHAPMGVPRQEMGVAAIGEVLYALGGFDAQGVSAVVESYDTRTDQWRVLASLPRALHHVGAAAVGGKLYAIGGLAADFTPVADVSEYDPVTDAWRPRASLPTARGAMGVAVIATGVYAAGGSGSGGSVGDFSRYDPATDAWTELPRMPTARNHLAAAAIAGRFYAVGGRDAGLFARIEVFDPATGAWQDGLAPMPTARGGLMADALGGRLFAFGGEGNAQNPLGVFPDTEAYDPVADRWEVLPPMPTPRHGTVAVTVGDAIYVPGGASRQGFGIAGVTESFVPPSGPVLEVRRLRVRGTRLRLRGRVAAPAGDPATAPLVLTVRAGTEVLATLELPPDVLVASGRRLRFRARAAAAGVTRAVLARRKDGALGIVLAGIVSGAESWPRDVILTLDVGGASFSGQGRLRRV